jgi:hypothetical protein
VVKDYRAALARNLLRNAVQNSEPVNSRPPLSNRDPQTPYTTDGQLASSNFNDIMSKKLDCIIAKVEEESKRTRETLEEFKEGMKERVVFLERKVESLQKEFNDYPKSVNTRLWNICSVMLDPTSAKDAR